MKDFHRFKGRNKFQFDKTDEIYFKISQSVIKATKDSLHKSKIAFLHVGYHSNLGIYVWPSSR